MHAQTKIFSCLIRDFMHRPKVIVTSGEMCGDVIEEMAKSQANCAVITDRKGRLVGILRIQDIVSKVAFKVPPQTPVDEVMDTRPAHVSRDEYLYHAIGLMRRKSIPDVIVVDENTCPVGIVRLSRCFEIVADRLIQQIDQMSGEGDREALKNIKSAQVSLAREMIEDKVAATDLQQLLSHVNNDIYRRLITTNLANMLAEGWGHPPVEFGVMIMGSGGRGENFLVPDQDNGFILEDYPDDDHDRVDLFFRELAERLSDDLNDVGFPYCTGHVMATNPLWRKTISQWQEQVALWGRKRNHVALRLADIFFDFKLVWGREDLGEELRRTVLDQIKRNHFFLQEMYHAQADHSVALGVFGRLEKEGEGKAKGMLDLKYRAILPLVESVRLLSLQHGITQCHTLMRIEKLNDLGVLSEIEADYLAEAHAFLTRMLLFKQVEDFSEARPVTHYIDPAKLDKHSRENLIDSLRHIEAFRKRLKGEFTGDVF